jgi:predicted PurR-regulated permease PerM
MIIPPIIEQVSRLSNNFPALWAKIVQNFNYLKDFSQEKGLSDNIQSGLNGLQSALETAASGVYSSVMVVFRSIVNFLVVLTIVFYLVVQKGAINRLFKVVAPASYHSYLSELFRKIQKKISDWAWGQLILGLIIGIFTFFSLLFFLPKYALVLALLAAITELVPYIGPILAAIPAVFLGFTIEPFSMLRGLLVLAVYIVIQQLEEKVIVPKVMERKVGLNPVIIIIIMLIGFKIAGIVGLILAVPVTTSIAIILNDFIQKSELPKIKAELDGEKENK